MTKLDFTKGRKRKPFSVRPSFLWAFSAAGAVYLTASSAFALSCVEPDIVRTLDEYRHSGSEFVLIRGSLDAPDLRPQEFDPNSEVLNVTESYPGHVEGVIIEGGVYGDILDEPITIVKSCIGPWCGTVASTESAFIFLDREGGDWTLLSRACGGRVFAANSEEEIFSVLDRIEASR